MSEAAQKVLTDHAVKYVEFEDGIETAVCMCGGRFNDPHGSYAKEGRLTHPQHQLAVLSETHAVVELPEPSARMNGVAWWEPRSGLYRLVVPDDRGVGYYGPEEFHWPRYA